MTGESRAFRIPADMFHSLRAHCIEIRDMVTEHPEGRERIDTEQSTTPHEAFCLGVLAAAMALEGRPATLRQSIPDEVGNRHRPRTNTGGQLKLFE